MSYKSQLEKINGIVTQLNELLTAAFHREDKLNRLLGILEEENRFLTKTIAELGERDATK